MDFYFIFTFTLSVEVNDFLEHNAYADTLKIQVSANFTVFFLFTSSHLPTTELTHLQWMA